MTRHALQRNETRPPAGKSASFTYLAWQAKATCIGVNFEVTSKLASEDN